MPFTLSHPAAVLPLNYLPKRLVSVTALAIGSMTPDFEYFIRMKVSSIYSHSWTGLFWFDLPLGLLIMLIYVFVIKDKLIAHLPKWLNRRFTGFGEKKYTPGFSSIVIISISILIGVASHILWDSFTHPSGYFVTHHRLLRHKIQVLHFHLELYNILQHLSTIIGALIIVYAIIRMPKGDRTSLSYKEIAYYWIKIAGIAVWVVLIRILAGLDIHQYGDITVTAISGSFIGLIIISATTKSTQAV